MNPNPQSKLKVASVSRLNRRGKRPRVLWVTPTLGSRFGGPTTTAVNGVIAERQSGLPSEIVTTVSPTGPADSQMAGDRLSAAGVKTRMFPRISDSDSAETWGLSPAMALWMIRNLASYDVIHLQYVWCMSSLLGCLLAKAFRVPVIVTPHESLTDYDIKVASRSHPKRLLKRLLRPIYLRTVGCIVFMSELERRDTFSGNRRTVLISHAVCESPVAAEYDSEARVERPLRIGFLGRNIEKKGIDRLIEALAGDPDRRWQLFVAGPPGTGRFVAEQDRLSRRLGVQGRITWMGFLPERDSLFSRCDILAMPSAYEGFGMVAAEAMSRGLPVVVPRRSGVAEIVSEYGCGIVIEDPGADELGAALSQFDSDRESWPRYRANSLRAVEERLTFGAYAEAINSLYDSLI